MNNHQLCNLLSHRRWKELKKDQFSVEMELESIKSRISQEIENYQTFLKNKNMTQESTEFIEVSEKHQMISLERESRFKMLLAQEDE